MAAAAGGAGRGSSAHGLGSAFGASDRRFDSLPVELEGLSEKQLATIYDAFHAFAGESGIMAKSDLAACLRSITYRAEETEVRRLTEEFAPSGRIDYMSFLAIVARQMAAIKRPDAMIVAFRTFDPEHKGFVTANEFRKIMGKLGAAPLPSVTVDEMVAYADPEDTGMVYYEAFVERLFADHGAMEKAKAAAKEAAKAGGKK